MIAVIFGGDTIRAYLAFIPREYFDLIDRKKWAFTIATFFFGNMISGVIGSTGAFEVFLHGRLV